MFQLECLEGRELLSAVKPAGIHAEVVATPITTIVGHVVLIRGSSGLFSQVPPGVTSYGGHGTASPVRFVTLGLQQVEKLTGKATPTVNFTQGTGLFATGRGEQIRLSYTGTGQAVSHDTVSVTLTGTITSGTGRFDGITGTFTATGNIRGARLGLTIVLTPKYPFV
jgi:hypothetical protein